ncbi:hypothetical protein [Oceanobacillus neutriphilus]|uniref:Uncharacterized protein n=1 Tax=Oceanobacillus neutriphilus TaxID=531815 RepID=A0ABQ2NY88_9BACI|nr:hypothetical protein [Oceanobacillus neutriphilus]GGP13458.1 hypothetical protein GCM10011346_33530 [Oceanobacillus neutriphilus]
MAQSIGLTEAIIASSNGHVIESFQGNRYTPSELKAKSMGEHAAVFESGIISKDEEKREWRTREVE